MFRDISLFFIENPIDKTVLICYYVVTTQKEKLKTMKKNNKNSFVLKGIVKTFPKNVSEDVFEFEIATKRYSGYDDVIKVIYNVNNLDSTDCISLITVGESIAVYGHLITMPEFDSITKQRHVNLRAFAEKITPGTDLPEFVNEVELEGMILGKLNRRITPLGRTILDFIVSNIYNQQYNYIVCLSWGRKADKISLCSEGDFITLKGRIQSREYNKQIDDNTIEIRTAYEVSINSFSLTIREG